MDIQFYFRSVGKNSKYIKTICISLFFFFSVSIGQAGVLPDHTSVTVEPFDLIEPAIIVNPILSASDVDDMDANFVADPFLFFENGHWYMFFEALNNSTDQGDIALATSDDGFHWTYQQVVLDETFHLSYPYVFKWQDEYYMIPETKQAGSIRLYRASEFPDQWVFESTLIEGVGGLDSSVFYYQGKWWMFTSPEYTRILDLYFADDIKGPWTRHPSSPIVEDDASLSRCGGRSFVFDHDRIIRIAQKSDVVYGQQVRAFEVDVLSDTLYAEHEIKESPILTEGGEGWRASGMHQFDPWWTGSYWLCSVDGHVDQIYSIGIYVSNTDMDNDGSLDYMDGCPNDSTKTEPGICGCGLDDIDSDSDGVYDCMDGCPNDSYKTEPGICGCGLDDIDSDGDGVYDCADGCPTDSTKSQAGDCGCGVADIDSDSDGSSDCVDTDDDNDGIPDATEQGPDGTNISYDGNNDGIADRLQANVVSTHDYNNLDYVTLEASAAASISNYQTAGTPYNAPSNVAFDFGLFEFTLNRVNTGGSIIVKLYLPAGKPVDNFYEYGPTNDDPNNHWYDFLYDGQTGASIDGNLITFHFVDGLRGDDDLSADGSIATFGGPGLILNGGSGGTGSGNGGCFIGNLRR